MRGESTSEPGSVALPESQVHRDMRDISRPRIECSYPMCFRKSLQLRKDRCGPAEGGRFELPRPLRACRFSRPVHSTALPPLQGVDGGG